MTKRRGTYAGDRAANAARVQRLREAGLNGKQIAARMGISHTYVYELLNDPDGIKAKARKDSYRKPCPQCGTLMAGQNGPNKAPKLCRSCAAKEQRKTKRWTREAVIEAIQAFAREHGRPPLATEWLAPMPYRGTQYPPASAVYSYASKRGGGKRVNHPFESWADAIEAAGFPRPKPGHKVRPYGQGAHHMEKEFIVLRKEADGRWVEMEPVMAYSPETALTKAAFTPGEYVALRATTFVRREFNPKRHDYTLLPATPGGN